MDVDFDIIKMSPHLITRRFVQPIRVLLNPGASKIGLA